MNKHLNNWLDKQEGLPQETTNKNIIREMSRQGVLASVNKRLDNKTQSKKCGIDELVKKASLSKEESIEFNKVVDFMVNNLNKNVIAEK